MDIDALQVATPFQYDQAQVIQPYNEGIFSSIRAALRP